MFRRTFLGLVLFLSLSAYSWATGCTGTGSCYWVGGTGNWSDTAHWATASGGGTTGGLPGTGDNVLFDEHSNEPSDAAYTVTVDAAANCADITFARAGDPSTGGLPTLSVSSTITLNVYGSVVYKSGMTVSGAGTVSFRATSGTKTITSDTVAVACDHTINGSGGTFQLADDFTLAGTNKQLTLTAGTFDPNGKTVSFTGAGSSTISGAFTFYNLTRTGTAAKTDTFVIKGNNITVTNNLAINGNSATNRVLVASDTIGTARTITVGGAVTVTNTDFRDITGAMTGTVSGSVTQANMRLSIVNGTAFADFSSAGKLTPFLNGKLTVTDSAGKKLMGYIKAAGTSETLGSELAPNTGFANTTDVNDYSGGTLASVAGGESGNCLQDTLDASGAGNATEACTTSDGMLLKATGYVGAGTATYYKFGLQKYGSPYTIYAYSQGSTPGSWTALAVYGTADSNTKTNLAMTSYGQSSAVTILFDTVSVKQVTAPSATGVTIVSTRGGTTYNWTSEESGFNRNDSSGYTYAIDMWDFSSQTDIGGGTTLTGCSGLTFPAAINAYWYKASGNDNWSTTGNWFLGSGGTGGASRFPLIQDTALFNSGSFGAGSMTLTQDMPRIGSVDFTGATNTPTWTTSTAASCFGSITLISGMTLTGSTQDYTMEGRSTYTFTSAGKSWAKLFNLNAPGGTITQQDAFITTKDTGIPNGTWATGGNALTARTLSASAGSYLNITNSLVTITGSSSCWTVNTTATLTSTGSTVKLTDTTATAKVFSSSKTYNNVWFAPGSGTGDFQLTSSGAGNTFSDFKDDGTAAHSVKFTKSTTTNVASWNVGTSSARGSNVNVITLDTVDGAGTFTVNQSVAGKVCTSYMNITRSTVGGTGVTWFAGAAPPSTNGGTNSGWTFANCASGRRTLLGVGQ